MSTAIKFYQPDESIAGLKAKIEAEATAVEQVGSQAVQHAWQCGKYLHEAKATIGHGGFVAYLNSDEWGRTRQTADTYMRIAMLDVKDILHLTLIGQAEKLASQQAKPRIADRVLTYISNNPGCTDDQIAEAIEEKPASVRGRRKELERKGLIRKCGEVRTGSKKPITKYEATGDEEEVEKAKAKNEKREIEQRAQVLADKVLKLDPRTRAAVMRRINTDKSVMEAKLKNVAKSQRYGDGTPKDHVLTCVVESYHRVSSALQQNGPQTNKRWISTLSREEKLQLRMFAENLSSSAKTLCDFLAENL